MVPVETMVGSYYSVVKVGMVNSDFVGSILMALQNCVVDFVVLTDNIKCTYSDQISYILTHIIFYES